MATRDDGGAWHTNQNNSVNPSTAGPAADGREVPTPEERISEFYDKHPDRAYLPLTNRHGERLRKEYAEEVRSEFETDAPREWDDPVRGEQVDRHEPLSWGRAVETLLRKHEETRKTTVNLERGRPGDAEFAEFSVDADTRWCSSYQRKYYAQLKAWLRETTGGQRPSGGETDGTMSDPKIVLLTRSASAVPDGYHVGPVDHTRQMADSWTSVYHQLRNTMRSLGFDWQYDRRLEPHDSKRGGGENACYGHEHVVLVVDGDVTPSDFRPIVEKHVESCEWAGEAAHDLNIADWDSAPSFEECPCDRGCGDCLGTVEIKDPDEVEDLAAYVASYAGIQPTDLLDRSTEYIAYAAVMNASNLRTKSRSDPAKHAAKADLCKQRYEDSQCEQSTNHAEEVVPSNRRGSDWECAECGSPHGVEQADPVADDDQDDPAVVDDDHPDDDLRARWPSARSATAVGEPIEDAELRKTVAEKLRVDPDLTDAQLWGKVGADVPPDRLETIAEQVRTGSSPADAESFERPPKWSIKSVTVGENEFPANPGTGIEMVEVSTRDTLVDHVYRETSLSDPGNEETYWRCQKTDVAMHGGRSMAAYLVKHGRTVPEVAERCVKAERGPLAD